MKTEPNLIYKITISVFLLLLLCSCANEIKQPDKQQKPTVDNVLHINLPDKVSDDICNVSDIADTIIYVPLETNSKSIFGDPRLIAMDDHSIIISDKKRIMAFKINGKFITQIGKTGNGPGEFNSVFNFLLIKDTIFITSVGKYGITKYTVDGKYIGFIRQKSQMVHFSELPNEGYTWYDRRNGNVVFFNDKWEITDTLPIEYDVSKKRLKYGGSATDDYYFFKTNNQLLFTYYRNDTIWDISCKKKEPAIIFNLKEKLLPYRLQPEFIYGMDRKEILHKLRPYHRLNIMPTDSFVYVFTRSYDASQFNTFHFYVYNKSNSEIKGYKKQLIYDDIFGIKLQIVYYSDNTIFSFVNYSMMKNAYKKATEQKVKEFWAQKLKGAKEDDNLTLVIVKTK